MRKPKADALAFSLLLISCVLVTWTGIAGPLFAARNADQAWEALFRWQTLVAALIALAAAGAAALPVYRQLAEQRRQSAAAAVTMIVKSAIALENERDGVRKINDDLQRLGSLLVEYDEQSLHDIYASWPEKAFSKMDICDAALRDMHRHSERNAEASTTQTARLNAIAALQSVRSSLVDLVTIMRQSTSGLSYEDGEEDIPEDEHQVRRDLIDLNRERWKDAAGQLDKALSGEISEVWRRIRQLERIAIGAPLSE